MKKILFGICLLLSATWSWAQNGLENVIVEKYYISTAADSVAAASNGSGVLPAGSVTYRLFADMLPGYKFQALYGVPGHTLIVNSSTSYFNDENFGAVTPANSASNVRKYAVLIDSYFSVGGGATGKMGVLKTDDTDGSPGNAQNMLQNNDTAAGAPINIGTTINATAKDGLVTGTPIAVTVVGISNTGNGDLGVFDGLSQVGGAFSSSNGSIAALGGTFGPDPATNRVLIGQFTTQGTFHFELNIQIGTPAGGIQNYVASNPVGNEITASFLTGTYTATPCTTTSSTTVAACNNYSWNGNTYTSSGTYTYQTTNAAGCDSIATLILTINNTSSSSSSITACNSYTWNGNTYTSTGTYTYQTINAAGCDSIATLELIINNTSSSTSSATACNSYTWNGNTYTTSGTYSYQTINAAGCDSIATLDLIINNTSSSSSSTTACNSYTWNGNTYTTSGTYTYQTTNAAGCDSTATLILNLVPFTVSGISGPVNACAYSGLAATDAVYSIGTVSATTITWSLPVDATLISGQGTNSIHVQYLSSFSSGTISVSVDGSCGGSETRTLEITKTIPSVPVTITGPSTVCNLIGTTTQVNYSIAPVADAQSYQWIVPANVTLVSGQGSNSINVIFNNGYVNSNFRVRAKSGCGNSNYKLLNVAGFAPALPTKISGVKFGICSPDNVVFYTLTPQASATSYIWSSNIPGAIVVSNNNTATITFPGFVSGQVSVYAANACGNSPIKTITVYSKPKFPGVITGQTTVCSGSIQSYSIDSIAGANSYTWILPSGSSIQTGAGTKAITVLIGSVGGDVKVKALNSCGTSNARSLPITVNNCTRTGQDDFSANMIVYPNPAQDLLNVQVNERATVQLLSIDGTEVILQTNLNENQKQEIDTRNLANGVYLIKVFNDNFVSVKKVVINK